SSGWSAWPIGWSPAAWEHGHDPDADALAGVGGAGRAGRCAAAPFGPRWRPVALAGCGGRRRRVGDHRRRGAGPGPPAGLVHRSRARCGRPWRRDLAAAARARSGRPGRLGLLVDDARGLAARLAAGGAAVEPDAARGNRALVAQPPRSADLRRLAAAALADRGGWRGGTLRPAAAAERDLAEADRRSRTGLGRFQPDVPAVGADRLRRRLRPRLHRGAD